MIKYISHRGNIDGIVSETENTPEQIDKAIEMGYDVEIDVRVKGSELFLGHDTPDYPISLDWLAARYMRLWIHAKDIRSAMVLMKAPYLHFFCHSKDEYVLTSKGWLWCHCFDKVLTDKCVIPLLSKNELESYNFQNFSAVCTDYPLLARQKFPS